jgi:hypothetical protein
MRRPSCRHGAPAQGQDDDPRARHREQHSRSPRRRPRRFAARTHMRHHQGEGCVDQPPRVHRTGSGPLELCGDAVGQFGSLFDGPSGGWRHDQIGPSERVAGVDRGDLPDRALGAMQPPRQRSSRFRPALPAGRSLDVHTDNNGRQNMGSVPPWTRARGAGATAAGRRDDGRGRPFKGRRSRRPSSTCQCSRPRPTCFRSCRRNTAVGAWAPGTRRAYRARLTP